MKAEIHCAYKSLIDPRTLRPHPSNPNEHGNDQVELFVEILKYQGWRRPITVSNRSGFITKGHGALAASLAGGYTEVPVDYQDYSDEAQELADIVADNQLQRMSKMNMTKLRNIVGSLDQLNVDLSLTGLDSVQIQSLKMMTAAAPVPPPVSDPSAVRYANPEMSIPDYDAPDNVHDHYTGMPEYNTQDLAPKKSITIHFLNNDDMQEFAKLIGQQLSERTRSIWYPYQAPQSAVDKRYDVQ